MRGGEKKSKASQPGKSRTENLLTVRAPRMMQGARTSAARGCTCAGLSKASGVPQAARPQGVWLEKAGNNPFCFGNIQTLTGNRTAKSC
jgi:hypothetical protein